MRNFQQSFFMLRRERVRQTNRQEDLPHPMRSFGHRPFGVHLESLPKIP